jgi:SAM-dependent methyltransferase
MMPEMAESEGLDPLRRFSDRVEDYVRYRPTYPAGLIGCLASRAGLGETAIVADIGSGTGIFTGLLLDAGARVHAVEPNDAMRSAAERAFRGRPNFSSMNGTAEATGLPERSVSLVTCAQAFHWFEPEETRREFLRILEPMGLCAIVWNTPIVDQSEFAKGYERLKEQFGTDFGQVRHDGVEKAGRCATFFGAGKWERIDFANHQVLDLQGLRGRLLSSSYAPNRGHPGHTLMMAALDDLFAATQENGLVRMDYTTELFLGRPAP